VTVRRGRLRAALAVLAGIALSGALILAARSVTRTEATINGWLVNVSGLADARPLGSAVIFPLGGR
jgi:hypothetical protein